MDSSTLMIAAMYELPIDSIGTTIDVCLGIRIGTTNEIANLQKRLVNQVRTRYPELFADMNPKEIERILQFPVFTICPNKYGLPRFAGEASWWQE